MFDETSSKWVRWWRNFVRVISILLVAAGAICLLSALGNDFLPEKETFNILGLVFAVAGCINYFFGMVIANLLYNIQKIRENTDKWSVTQLTESEIQIQVIIQCPLFIRMICQHFKKKENHVR